MGANHSQRGYLAAIYWHNALKVLFSLSITMRLKADNPMSMWHFMSHLQFDLGVPKTPSLGMLGFPSRVEVEMVAMAAEC